jgi:hypothetical protein
MALAGAVHVVFLCLSVVLATAQRTQVLLPNFEHYESAQAWLMPGRRLVLRASPSSCAVAVLHMHIRALSQPVLGLH